jgi:hypothetical protein
MKGRQGISIASGLLLAVGCTSFRPASEGDGGASPGPSGGDTAVRRFCITRTPPPTACVDFDDDVVPTAGGWSVFVAPPSALGVANGAMNILASRDAGDAAPSGAALHFAFGEAPRPIEATFALYVEEVMTQAPGRFDLVAIELENDTETYVVTLGVLPSVDLDTMLDVTRARKTGEVLLQFAARISAPLPKQRRVSISVDLAVATGGSMLRVAFDGTLVSETPLLAHEMTTLTRVTFGDRGVDEGTHGRVRFDDLTVTRK